MKVFVALKVKSGLLASSTKPTLSNVSGGVVFEDLERKKGNLSLWWLWRNSIRQTQKCTSLQSISSVLTVT